MSSQQEFHVDELYFSVSPTNLEVKAALSIVKTVQKELQKLRRFILDTVD